MSFVKKYRKFIFMILSLVLVIAFFMPWISMNPDFKMFKTSDAKYSAYSMVRGIDAAVPTVTLLGKLYDFKMLSKLIYLGYSLWLIPILGIIAILLSGLQLKAGNAIQMIQYVFTLLIVMAILITVNFNADMRMLFGSMFRFGVGFYLSVLASLLGPILTIALKVNSKER